jgi:hypothetical protein
VTLVAVAPVVESKATRPRVVDPETPMVVLVRGVWAHEPPALRMLKAPNPSIAALTTTGRSRRNSRTHPSLS